MGEEDGRANEGAAADEAVALAEEPRPAVVAPPRAAIETARRVGESFVVAIVTSTGLYLVGWVYTTAYYTRMSIEPTALDFAPPYVALQAVHALPGLLQYPTILLLLWLVYRTIGGPVRRVAGWGAATRRRFPRMLPIVVNLIVIAPLLAEAVLASVREETVNPASVAAEIASVLENAAVVLLVYAVWLGWSQRETLVAAFRARKTLPIVLVFLVYLLAALASTSGAAEIAAIALLTGESDGSMGVELTLKDGAEPAWGDRELVLVTARQSTYFVVEREPFPPSLRPTSWMVPAGSVQTARVRRLTDADQTLEELVGDGE